VRKSRLFVLCVAGFSVGLAAASRLPFSDYAEAWRAWGAGRSTSGLIVGGWPVLLWGRVGKVMQFVAGLVAVFDFVDVEMLRDVGRRRRDKYAAELSQLRATRLARTAGVLERRLRRTVLTGPAAEVPPGVTMTSAGTRLGWWVKKRWWFWIPSRVVTRRDARRFREGTLEHYRGQIKFRKGSPYVASDDLVNQRARELVMERLGPEYAEAVDRFERQAEIARDETGCLLAPFMLLAFGALCVTGVLGRLGVSTPWLGEVFAYSVVAYVGLFVLLMVVDVSARGLVVLPRLLANGLVAGVSRVLVSLLDRANPDHQFRVVGLALFVVGFHLDLLSS